MRAIVSCRYGVVIVDTDVRSVVRTVRTGSYETLYYGITFSEHIMFLAKRQIVQGTERACYIEQLDQDFGYHESIYIPGLEDVHQILLHNGLLWMTSSGNDMILSSALERPDLEVDRWAPWGMHGTDKHHVNSIWFHMGKMYLVAHKKGQSELYVFEENRQPHNSHRPLGVGAHNVFHLGDKLGVLDSSSGNIALVGGGNKGLKKNSYPRGWAYHGGVHLIGYSSHNTNREERDKERVGGVVIYDKDFVCQAQIPINMGQVYEVRFLDVPDRAHNNRVWKGSYGADDRSGHGLVPTNMEDSSRVRE